MCLPTLVSRLRVDLLHGAVCGEGGYALLLLLQCLVLLLYVA